MSLLGWQLIGLFTLILVIVIALIGCGIYLFIDWRKHK